jgi:uncharacterized protein (TIGR02271 family)
MKAIDPNEQQGPSRRNRKQGDEHTVLPVVEERLQVGTRAVETGRVSVSKTVSEREESITVPLKQEDVQVERVARNEFVKGEIPQVRHEGDTTIIPVLREEVVVQKRLLLVEEIHITKKLTRTEKPIKVKLRKEEARVQRKPPSKKAG